MIRKQEATGKTVDEARAMSAAKCWKCPRRLVFWD